MITSFRNIFILLAFAFFLLPCIILAQNEKKSIVDGNTQYENKKYTEAEKSYLQALNKNKNSIKGAFNLGDAYYQQGKYEEAAQQFQLLTHRATTKDTLSKAYHNLGNALMQQKKFQEGANAYKNALKNNPNDEDTRYNLAYALQMLKQQQNQQNKDNKNNKDNKDNKDKQENKENKDENKDKKDKEQKENKDNKDQKEDEKQKEEQPKKNEISKEDAQRLLDALENDEKNLQEKRKAEKVRGVKVEIEKDW